MIVRVVSPRALEFSGGIGVMAEPIVLTTTGRKVWAKKRKKKT